MLAWFSAKDPRQMVRIVTGKPCAVARHAVGNPLAAEIGRAHAELQSRPHLVCRLLLEKKKKPRVSRLFPSARRIIGELAIGTTAIITCTCGLNPSNDSACDIYRIYERKRADIQDCRRF